MLSMIVPNSSNSSEEGGNTISPSSPSKKQISPALRWCFTLNNYTKDELCSICSIVPEFCSKCVIGDEVGESGTPHLQGFIRFKTKKRPKSVFPNERIHWEKCKGTDIQNIEYCSKEKVTYSFGVSILLKMTYDLLKPRQRQIADLFAEDEDPLFGRQVHWCCDYKGGWGKSILCKFFVDQKDALIVGGSNNDILHGVVSYIDKHSRAPSMVIIDVPRVNKGMVSYQAIESIKNGCFFSGKYESTMVRFNSPHILVMSNQLPDVYKLSADRWRIYHLEDDKVVPEKVNENYQIVSI